MPETDLYIRQRGIPIPSPKGINIIAQGKDGPGSPRGHPEAGWHLSATLGQIASVIPTLKGSNILLPFRERMAGWPLPGVTLVSLTHPRLLYGSPSATRRRYWA